MSLHVTGVKHDQNSMCHQWQVSESLPDVSCNNMEQHGHQRHDPFGVMMAGIMTVMHCHAAS